MITVLHVSRNEELIAINVSIQGYSPLGKGLSKTNILNNRVLHTIAEKLGKTPAQIALRWGLQMGHSVLPKSTNPARIKENFDLFDWSIPEDFLANFSEIEQASHFMHSSHHFILLDKYDILNSVCGKYSNS